MREGDDYVTKTSRSSLKLLGTVGEPINPEAWQWYHRVVGKGRCPIVDTWWQTETGGILITPLPGATKLKPGSATKPFFGIQPVIVDPQSSGAAAVKLRISSASGDDDVGFDRIEKRCRCVVLSWRFCNTGTSPDIDTPLLQLI